MSRTILIIDDSEINRKLLIKALGNEYDTLEAENGVRAMEIVRRERGRLSAVLLDILMPEMDGYEVLRQIRADEELRQLPVLVTTGNTEEGAEVRALKLGANDFLTKPYSPAVIRHRLYNTIHLRETAAEINALQRDRLTGLYNREAFFERADDMLAKKEPGHYIMARLDVGHFAVVNDQYGTQKGDEVLKRIAGVLQSGFEPAGALCCRVGSDDFAVLYPRSFSGTQQIEAIHEELTRPDPEIPPITYSIGRCLVDDPALSASAAYDRAAMAEESIKDRFDVRIADYTASMRDDLLRQQEIVGVMKTALAQRQFEVWYQPQFNHSTGALIGSEALVRWRRPEKGLVPPAEFIPVFERNGFIYELDKYVWEQVCVFLHRRIDEGGAVLPVAVNISRYDIFRPDFYAVITELVTRYRIPTSLMHIEITESAFSELPAQIIAMVKRLIDFGFTVEIDDFGSGYSSLNTLKDVPASVLKLDMRFLESSENAERGGNIVEAIVRMATWLGMPVIAEGVETREQADYLRSIGCHYVQGYLYARPMPEDEFIALTERTPREEKASRAKTANAPDNETFWDPASMQTLIFNSYTGGAGIFEYREGSIELLRINEKYAAELCGPGTPMELALAIRLHEHMDAENQAYLNDNILRAIETDEEAVCEACLTNLPGRTEDAYIRAAVRVIARAEDRLLLYCSIIDQTPLRRAERHFRDAQKELLQMMNDTPGGYARMRLMPDGTLGSLFINEGFCRLVGMKRAQIMAYQNGNVFEGTHPDDVEAVESAIRWMVKTGEACSLRYRLRHGSGGYVHLTAFGRVTGSEAGEQFLNVYFSAQLDGEKGVKDMLPAALGAVMRSTANLDFVKDKALRYVCCSDAFVQMLGLGGEAEIVGKTDRELVDEKLAAQYAQVDRTILERGTPLMNYLARLPAKDGERRYANTSKYPLYDADGQIIGIYGTGRDVTEERAAYARLKLLTDSIPGGLATYACAPDGIRLTYFNDGFCQNLGYTREEYEKQTEHSVMSRVYEEDAPIIMEQLAALKRDGTPVDCTYRVHARDGGCKWINLRGTPAERHGSTVIVHAVQLDVTRLREAEERLRISDAELRLALSLMGKLVLLYDIPARRLTLAKAYADKHGLPPVVENAPESLAGTGLVGKADEAAFGKFFDDILRGEKHCTAEAHIRCPNGEWLWERAEAVTVAGSDGKPVRAVIAVEDVTKQHNARAERESMRSAAEVMRLVVEHSARVIYRYDVATQEAVSAAPQASAAMGLPDYVARMPESLIEQGVIVPEDADYVRELFRQARTRPQGDAMRFRVRSENGAVRWLDVKYTFIRTDKEPTAAIISCLDITDQHERELAFERYRLVAQESETDNAVYFETDITANIVEKAGGELLPPDMDVCAQPHSAAVTRLVGQYLTHAEQEAGRRYFSRESLLTAYADGHYEMERIWQAYFPDGSEHWLNIAVQLVSDPYTGHVKAYTLIKDVTEENRARMEIQQRAAYDGMTGLLNRSTAEEAMRAALQRDGGGLCAMLILDLDDLKTINDQYGHAEGDRAIKAVAAAIRASFRKSDIVGRAGGDEFFVLLKDVPDEARVSAMLAALLRRIGAESVGEDGERPLRASIGAAFGEPGKDDFEGLFAKADMALYHVKRSGKNSFAFYTPKMQMPGYSYAAHPALMLRDETMYSKAELQRLLSAISSFFTLVLSVNLTRNSYYLMEYKSFHVVNLQESGVFDEAGAAVAESIHPDDRGAFAARFSREALLKAFARGEPNIRHTCRQIVDEGFQKIEIILVFYREDDGDICEFSFIHAAEDEETDGQIS